MRTLIVALAVAVLALTAGASGSAQRTAEFTATVAVYTKLDIGRTGPSSGDTASTLWRLNDREGRAIGAGHQVCRLTSAASSACYGAYVLPRGQISFAGVVEDGVPRVLSVTGGTGLYRAAAGQLTRVNKTVKIEW